VQLQQSLPDLHKRGLGLAAVSYDAPATLKAFADRRGITFFLLSDAGSSTIRKYGILNTEASGPVAGIPYPGTFVLDSRGIVISRSFEERYEERASALALVARPGAGAPGDARKVDTRHIVVTPSSSDTAAAPGTRISLFLDVVPKPKMHVYTPEQKELIPISLSLTEDAAFKAHAAKFPKSEKYFFEPLGETQLVYSKPFRIVQDVTIALTPAMRQRARGSGATLTITGTLRYQACDDKVCYMPQEVAVSWTIQLRPLQR
jgi:hypothetical protein